MPPYEVDDRGDVVLRILVQPGAARSAVVGPHGDALKVRIAAAPERGRANEALTRLLAAELGVRRTDVAVVGGTASRRKRVRVSGLGADRIAAWLDGLPG